MRLITTPHCRPNLQQAEFLPPFEQTAFIFPASDTSSATCPDRRCFTFYAEIPVAVAETENRDVVLRQFEPLCVIKFDKEYRLAHGTKRR